MRTFTDKEVDAMPRYFHPNTPQRLKQRQAWGEQAGRAARFRGVSLNDNPFAPSPSMPMYDGWKIGWFVADLAEAGCEHLHGDLVVTT